MNYNSIWYKAFNFVVSIIANIEWSKLKGLFRNGRYYDLTDADHEAIKAILAKGNYIILINRKTHLTTYLISILSLLKTGRVASYTHALMNLDVGNSKTGDGFDLMEATGKGVHYSSFMEVFDCDSVCILQPRNMHPEDWDLVMIGLSEQLGKLYDDVFDLEDSSRVSCVEMCLDALRKLPCFNEDFPNLSTSIKKIGNLTPQMYYDCQDFRIVYEVRR